MGYRSISSNLSERSLGRQPCRKQRAVQVIEAGAVPTFWITKPTVRQTPKPSSREVELQHLNPWMLDILADWSSREVSGGFKYKCDGQ